jgi:hypothetical protein
VQAFYLRSAQTRSGWANWQMLWGYVVENTDEKKCPDAQLS